ncbi:NlpC/P60 family protein [Dongia deserti]|uniref:NlpC/P60 family protein n=1 Tax=Dongia deserti TaxID=2268030 RepID=UPI000E65A4A0|nr:NlpC/P60 family protein [Dongia deserti]
MARSLAAALSNARDVSRDANPHVARTGSAGGTPPDQPQAWARAYIGLPWKELGRDRAGVDCWGLVRLPLLEVFGCDTPLHDTGYVGCGRRDVSNIAALIAAGKGTWPVIAEAPYYRNQAVRPTALTDDYWLCPIGDERPGDLLLIRQHGAESHIALVAGGGHMLHIEEGTDSVCESYIDGQWRRRIVGIYRHPRLVHP